MGGTHPTLRCLSHRYNRGQGSRSCQETRQDAADTPHPRLSCSNVNRGKWRKAQAGEPATIKEFSEVSGSAAKRAWARLIKQVYEVDPLVCPRWTGPKWLIAFIEQPAVIEKILTHLGMWAASAHSPPVESLAA